MSDLKERTLESLSEETGISPEIMEKCFKEYCYFIAHTIRTTPMKGVVYKDVKAFGLPKIGRLYCTGRRHKFINELHEKIKKD